MVLFLATLLSSTVHGFTILPSPKLQYIDKVCSHGINLGFREAGGDQLTIDTCAAKVNDSTACKDGGGYFFLGSKYKMCYCCPNEADVKVENLRKQGGSNLWIVGGSSNPVANSCKDGEISDQLGNCMQCDKNYLPSDDKRSCKKRFKEYAQDCPFEDLIWDHGKCRCPINQKQVTVDGT